MCVQDVKIGRNTEAVPFAFRSDDTDLTVLATPDAERVAVVIGWRGSPALGVGAFAALGTRVGATVVTIAALTQDAATCIVRIEDIGVLIQGQLVISGTDGNGYDVTGAAIRLRTPLERI